jgi:hypothetical protein
MAVLVTHAVGRLSALAFLSSLSRICLSPRLERIPSIPGQGVPPAACPPRRRFQLVFRPGQKDDCNQTTVMCHRYSYNSHLGSPHMIMIYELRWEAVSPPVRNTTPSADGS